MGFASTNRSTHDSTTEAALDTLKILIIEDSDDDAFLICEELRRGGYEPQFVRVENEAGLREALAKEIFEIAISDYTLPEFTALQALEAIHATGKDIPVIVVSGSVRESTIVEAMRAGARDYVMKGNLTRLPLAVARELEEAADRRQRRQFEEQLRHTQRLESLGVLAGGVAHDFNNLLTGILGNVSLAAGEISSSARIRPMLEQAIQAAEQAANLTRQMLAYAGKGRFVVEPVDVSATVRDISALLHASLSKNIELIFQLENSLPPIEADRGQIQQLLMNLVVNAAEAIAPEQAGAVIVGAVLRQLTAGELREMVICDELQPGAYIALEVRDSGVGMDADIQRRIFDPFFTTKFTGRGLGLSATMGIVRAHKGTIKVHSEPGRGSVFTVFFPVLKAATSATEKPGPESPLAGALVLVIDDEEVIRRAAKAILERSGFQVMLADNGRAGVETLRRVSDRVAVVLLDLTMPVLNGNETLREIRAVRGDVPVIVSSGYNEADAMTHITGQVSAFIQKPYTSAQLLQKVRTAIVSNAAKAYELPPQCV